MSCISNRRGVMLPFIAITLLGLMSLLVLAIDGGNLQREKRIAQNAADAGAQAGAQEILRVHSDSAIAAAAFEEAARNGFTNADGRHVAITHPTTSPDPWVGNYVKVVVEDTVRTIFGGIIGRGKVVIRARAFGGIISPSTYCVTVLAPTGADALLLQTGGDLHASGCSIGVNSSDPKALENKSSNSELDASSISVVGGYTNSGTITPTPLTGQSAKTDPLAYVVMPSSGACDHNAKTDNDGDIQSAVTLDPGVWCGDDKNSAIWSHGSKAVATFNPGVYFIKGGGLRLSTGGKMYGTGVTFVLMNGYVNVASYYVGVNFETGTHAELSATTSGPLAGILFYQDPTAGVANTVYENLFQTDGSSTLSGSFYFPTQKVVFRTGSAMTLAGGIVAKWMLVETGTNLTITGNGGGGNSDYFKNKRGSIVE